MKKIFSIFILGLSICSTSVYAEVATTESVATLQTSIDTLGVTVTNQQNLVSKLSDDIGLMADRIGTMADRIVATETLLANTLVVLSSNPDLVGGSSANGVALTAPTDTSPALSQTVAPTITTVPSATSYLLYASTEPTFTSGSTVALYIDSTTTLESKWGQVYSFYTAQGSPAAFYLAVKRVDSANTISSISNGVKVTFQ